jgi:hypothetical protein
MRQKSKVQISLAINITLLIFMLICAFIFAQKTPYWRVGWSDTFILVSTKINTWWKYVGLLVLIAGVNICSVIVSELGGTVLSFTIYNPDKKYVLEFTKNELYMYTNLLFFTTSLRGIFGIILMVSQIDVALWQVITQEITSLFTSRILLNEKTYVTQEEYDRDIDIPV